MRVAALDVRDRADGALRRLTRRVVEAAAGVPCVGDERWTAPRSVAEVAEAMLGCRGCPVLDDCRTFAAAERPREVVLGGLWWTRGGVPADGVPERAPRR